MYRGFLSSTCIEVLGTCMESDYLSSMCIAVTFNSSRKLMKLDVVVVQFLIYDKMGDSGRSSFLVVGHLVVD